MCQRLLEHPVYDLEKLPVLNCSLYFMVPHDNFSVLQKICSVHVT